ncbi:MAG: M56 family metallopeptidase, partial [Gemmatimonadetes bacterium]|nr:M56 family metallopeptidase [Gemmatimonadota bacterium]NNL30501.1 M56 family metallopeptidase [Gemmatimonadota bacterium]
MMAGVVVFLGAVSLLVWSAVWAADQGLRRLGLPTRGLWLFGLVAPFALLLLPLFWPNGAPLAGVGSAPTPPVFELAPLVVGGGLAGLGLWISVALGVVWALSSIGLVATLVRSHRTLTRERRAWPASEVAGRAVYVSADRGPAVAGLWKPWIVLPRWALQLPSQELDFVLLHEEEHVRARDTLLLAGALAFVALTPWSPGAWLHLRGLKVAMEVDCDRRVLRRDPDRATYGESLLTVAARSSGLSLGLAAFTEKERSLKTRILTMTSRATRWTALRSLLFLAVATLVGLQACYVESPILIIADDDEVADAVRA